jgi:hypothetical protein
MENELKSKLKSLALADAILSPEWEYRYFSYNSKWYAGQEMASMRDGEGGCWFILFFGNNIGYKCISPEDGTIDNLQEIKKQIPATYQSFINEPAFYVDDATSIWILINGKWNVFGK